MIEVQDLILGVRQRLGDTNDAKYHYAPEEIIDAINTALEDISDATLCFTRTWLIPCVDGVHRYRLPADFLRPISVDFNGVHVDTVQSMESRKKEIYTVSGVSVSYDMQTLHLYPATGIKKEHTIELYYNNHENINDKTDTIGLPATAKLAIIYHVLGELFDNPVRKNGTEKSNRFRKLYLDRLAKLKNRLSSNKQSKRTRSPYVVC